MKKKTIAMILVCVSLSIYGCSAEGEKNDVQPAQSEETEVTDDETAETPEESADVLEDVPKEYKSALNKAKDYSEQMHMSKAGLYDQLTSEYGEQFSAEAAQYAIDNVNADWNENALAKAKEYQETMDMSPEAIRDQLASEFGEKFTQEEADYAIGHLEQ